jgi:hypothetical protein
METAIWTCACGAASGWRGFSYSGGEFRPNVQQAVEAWERAMGQYMDAPEGWYRDYLAGIARHCHELLLDYGVEHHSELGCSMTQEEAAECRARWDKFHAERAAAGR